MSHDYYTVRPHRDEADLDLEGNGDALALHARLRSVAFLDGGRLPLDPADVRKRARVSAHFWRRAWPLVSKKWRTSDDGRSLVNDDLRDEIDRVRVYLDRCAAGGRKGAPSRWPETRGKAGAEGSGGEQVLNTPCQEGTGLDRNGLDRKGGEGTGLERAAQSRALAPPPPPSPLEVAEYVAEKGYAFDPGLFWAHYDAIGWVQSSGQPIKRWRSACDTWELREGAGRFS